MSTIKEYSKALLDNVTMEFITPELVRQYNLNDAEITIERVKKIEQKKNELAQEFAEWVQEELVVQQISGE